MHAFSYVLAFLRSLEAKHEEQGATAVEYALVVGLVSIVVVGAVALFGGTITTFVEGLSFR